MKNPITILMFLYFMLISLVVNGETAVLTIPPSPQDKVSEPRGKKSQEFYDRRAEEFQRLMDYGYKLLKVYDWKRVVIHFPLDGASALLYFTPDSDFRLYIPFEKALEMKRIQKKEKSGLMWLNRDDQIIAYAYLPNPLQFCERLTIWDGASLVDIILVNKNVPRRYQIKHPDTMFDRHKKLLSSLPQNNDESMYHVRTDAIFQEIEERLKRMEVGEKATITIPMPEESAALVYFTPYSDTWLKDRNLPWETIYALGTIADNDYRYGFAWLNQDLMLMGYFGCMPQQLYHLYDTVIHHERYAPQSKLIPPSATMQVWRGTGKVELKIQKEGPGKFIFQ